jgi:hypothetical protein
VLAARWQMRNLSLTHALYSLGRAPWDIRLQTSFVADAHYGITGNRTKLLQVSQCK